MVRSRLDCLVSNPVLGLSADRSWPSHLCGRSQMTEEDIFWQIECQRAVNNALFMKMWRLCFEVAPERAKEIQREIRAGDLRISELNAKLCE